MTISLTKNGAEIGELSRLRLDLKRSKRAQNARALALIAPLLIFLLLVFLGPIAALLSRSVRDDAVGPVFPRTISALSDWDGKAVPNEAAFRALVADLQSEASPQAFAMAGGRLNSDVAGMRSLILNTRTRVKDVSPDKARASVLKASQRWEGVDPWASIWRARGPLTDFYLLNAVDHKRSAEGVIEPVGEAEQVFVAAIGRTFSIAFGVTGIALLLGFPLAYLISTVGPGRARLITFMVLLPFWTAVLVRTLSWAVLLQQEGIVNSALMSLGLIASPLALMFNRFAVYVALVHIFLPYMVLPLLSVMKTVPQSHLHAAASLGSRPLTTFRRVYLPQAAPGIAAGCLLVFIQSLGVFVTPAILGGASDQGIPYLIAFYVNQSLNWGLAASLSLLLLVTVLLFYWLFTRLTGKSGISMD